MEQDKDVVAKLIEEEREKDQPSILIIDDEKNIATILSKTLESENYRITVQSDGARAIETVDREEFDVVITDVVMPGASGVAVLKHIKELYPETEVIMITGQASVSSAAEAVRHGAADYLLKPFDNLQMVRMAVRRALTRRQLVRLVRKFNARLQESTARLKRQTEAYENFEEVAHVCAGRTVESVRKLVSELEDSLTPAARMELDGIMKDNEELRDLVDKILSDRIAGHGQSDPV